MTIASEIQRIQGNIADAYNACAAKGATMPVTNNSASLANTIDTITGGGGGTAGAVGFYMVVNGVAMPQNANLIGRFDGIIEISANAMKNSSGYFIDLCNPNTAVAFPDLTTIGDNGMNGVFRRCWNIPSVDFPKLTSIANFGLVNTFASCQNSLTIANFNSLTEINGIYALSECFANCKNMVCASFPNLVSANGEGCFSGTFTYTNITELNFPKLENVGPYAFSGTGRFMNKLTNANFCNVVSVNDSSFSIFANNSSSFAGYANFSSLSSVSNSMVFSYAFWNTNVTSVDFANLKIISGANAFNSTFAYCNNLISANFNSLENISGARAFYDTFLACNSLTELSFPNLISVAGMHYCFVACGNLTDVYMPNLYNIAGNGMNYAFAECPNIRNVAFNSLYNISYGGLNGAFLNCTSITELRFPALGQAWDNSFAGMLSGCTGVTVHFPAAMQSTMSGWASVTGGFGGTSTTVLFDL